MSIVIGVNLEKFKGMEGRICGLCKSVWRGWCGSDLDADDTDRRDRHGFFWMFFLGRGNPLFYLRESVEICVYLRLESAARDAGVEGDPVFYLRESVEIGVYLRLTLQPLESDRRRRGRRNLPL